MIEFISHHYIVVPLLKIPNSKFRLRLILTAFQQICIEDDHIEVMIIYERIVTSRRLIFLKRIGVAEYPEGYVASELVADQFQVFMNNIEFKGTCISKGFNKLVVPASWTVLIRIIMKGFNGKHGGPDTMNKYWINLIYSSFTGLDSII